MESLQKEVEFIKGIGARRSHFLNKLGIKKVFDLFWHIPRAYENYNNFKKIADLTPGEVLVLRGEILRVKKERSPRGMQILKVLIADESGSVNAVWYNQSYLVSQFKVGQKIMVKGKVKFNYNKLEINVANYELITTEKSVGILPVYALVNGITQKFMRNLIKNAMQNFLADYPDILPVEIRKELALCDIYFAWQNIHFPTDVASYRQARKRLAFEEALLYMALIKFEDISIKSEIISGKKKKRFVPKKDVTIKLPFELTPAQKRVLEEIYKDIDASRPMNRLLQGDVGSGKTVVAILAMLKVVSQGLQAALMAPTEILSNQHYATVKGLLANHDEVVMAQLTATTPQQEKKIILEALESGEIDILVGTHSLIQERIKFKKLGLAVIDEQHRFGVRQRALLGEKGNNPDVLVMTATPIPRTLALTVYGSLDISVIDSLPPGRKLVKTKYINQSLRGQAYEFLKKEVLKGGQAYIVCPLIEESEKQDLVAATALFNEIKKLLPSQIKVGLLHGKMSGEEKSHVLENFKLGKIKILVATTVVEVGVDVPLASIMLIEHAERFGLAQLHQLRGRVGRGTRQSYCILIADPQNDIACKRLQAMEKISDGFNLANIDLALRGPGDFWGFKQHGLENLKILNLSQHHKIIAAANLLINKNENNKLDYLKWKDYLFLKFKTTENIAPN